MILSEQEIIAFQKKIYDFYYLNRRDFLWRNETTPYNIVVSEIMLQQTQTSRVVHKFIEWIKKFPNFEVLAHATTQEVLFCWQGLGYNRRGLALYEFAKRIINEFNGIVPSEPDLLQTFKGIGPNTAASICAFAFNKPVTFIETNIRTVFIHEFFKDQKEIHDKQLMPLIEQAVDIKNPREWYYALMDYGVYLKTVLKISNKASKHYTKQSKFVGSKRQVRGEIVRILSKLGSVSYDELSELVLMQLPENNHTVDDVLEDLQKDGFLKINYHIISLVS